jgi:hypothetical protein
LGGREVEALRLISEQVALPLDQLARFLRCEDTDAQAVVDRLDHAGCLRSEQFLVGDSEWVWLRKRGARLAGKGFRARRYPPIVACLSHRRAINEVRLLLERKAPHGRWLSENLVRTQRETKADIPDAIFEVNGERHAIEVELSNKTKRRLRHTLEERSARYDAVIYFCGPRTRKLLDDAKGEGCWPKLIVRGLPEHPAWALPGRSMDSSSTSPWKPPPQPADWEVRIFRLLAEQGAIPVDQLSRFLDRSAEETASVVAAFCEAHYTVSQQLLAAQPAWVWLKERGARFSGTSLYPQRPRPGGLDRMRAVNEVRLHVSGRDPHGRWVSRRRLLRRYGQYAVVPSAVAESGDQRHALNVKLTMRNNLRLASQIDTFVAGHDAVVYFCATPQVRGFLEELQRENHWSKLVIRDMPKAR